MACDFKCYPIAALDKENEDSTWPSKLRLIERDEILTQWFKINLVYVRFSNILDKHSFVGILEFNKMSCLV